MTQEDFRSQYAQLSDDELISVAFDRKDLLPDAAVALDEEVRRRGVKVEHPKWLRLGEPVYSLEDYDSYRQLCVRQKSWNRYGYIAVMGPVFIAMLLSQSIFKSYQLASVIVVATALLWAGVVSVNKIVVSIQMTNFKCPQCGHRFRTDAECWSCGFPRQPK